MRSLALAYMFVTRAALAFLPGRAPGFRFPLTFSTTSMAEKVLTNPKWPESWPYSKEDFMRMDESSDALFYDQPRLVYHIDDVRVSALVLLPLSRYVRRRRRLIGFSLPPSTGRRYCTDRVLC